VSTVTSEQVLDALRLIEDPDLHKDIVSLGFITKNDVVDGKITVTINLTTPACPVKDQMRDKAVELLRALPGAKDVQVEMTAEVRGQQGPPRKIAPNIKHFVAITSGKGGVGKSTTAVNIALALQQAGATVGILDADVYGPSLPLLTGTRGRPEAEEKRIFPLEAFGMKLMSMGYFISENSPVIWRGPMVHGLIRQFLTDVVWGDLDYLIIDMPPGTGDAALTLTQQAPLAGAVIVTTSNDLSTIDARKGLTMFEKVQVPVLGIVENMSYFIPPDLPDRKYHIFGEGGGKRIAEELGVDFLGEIPIDPMIVERGDKGRPIVMDSPESPSAKALTEIAGLVARKLAVLAENAIPIADANITWVTKSN